MLKYVSLIALLIASPAMAQDVISTQELHDEFKANNFRAETLYKGKTLAITGVFDNIKTSDFAFEGTDLHVTLLANLANPFSQFRGTVAPNDARAFASLNHGEHVTIECVIGDTFMDDPTGTNCTLVPPQTPTPVVVQAPVHHEETPTPLVTEEIITPSVTATAVAPKPENSMSFTDGLKERTDLETWINNLKPGDFHDGVMFWTAHRSDKVSPGCHYKSPTYEAGCQAAKSHLDASDARRKADPGYRLGWNSYQTAS